MWIRYFVPGAALAAMVGGVVLVAGTQRSRPLVDPPRAGPTSDFASRIAGTGLVEPSSEIADLGVQVAGVIRVVAVGAGQQVRMGDLLLVVDDRAARAEVAVREAAVAAARTRVEELLQLPRAESVELLRERVATARADATRAEAELSDQRDQYERLNRLNAQDAATRFEKARRGFAVQAAEGAALSARQKVREAEAALRLESAGAFAPTVAVARAELQRAEADLAAAQTRLEQHRVVAPFDGEVLEVSTRVGEYAAAGGSGGLIRFGQTQPLHIRVEVDQLESGRLGGEPAAVAMPRGDAAAVYQLAFVRYEPLVVPKRSLTGTGGDRVDTRVLQVIYRIVPDERLPTPRVGQQFDVFICVD